MNWLRMRSAFRYFNFHFFISMLIKSKFNMQAVNYRRGFNAHSCFSFVAHFSIFMRLFDDGKSS